MALIHRDGFSWADTLHASPDQLIMANYFSSTDTQGISTMWYAIISQDIENSNAGRKANRDAHLARLHELVAQGRLFAAGPNPAIDSEDPGEAGFSGSLIIAEFESLEAAQAWAEQDPYVVNGVQDEVVVKPYKKVLP